VLKRHLHGKKKTKLIPHSTVSQRERGALFPKESKHKENQNLLGFRTILRNGKILFHMGEN
jgi:hypothetical protein